MGCGCGQRAAARQGLPQPEGRHDGTFAGGDVASAPRKGDPVVAAATGRYHVLTAGGERSGREFSSYVLAEQFARRIRGTVVPI